MSSFFLSIKFIRKQRTPRKLPISSPPRNLASIYSSVLKFPLITHGIFKARYSRRCRVAAKTDVRILWANARPSTDSCVCVGSESASAPLFSVILSGKWTSSFGLPLPLVFLGESSSWQIQAPNPQATHPPLTHANTLHTYRLRGHLGAIQTSRKNPRRIPRMATKAPLFREITAKKASFSTPKWVAGISFAPPPHQVWPFWGRNAPSHI